MRDFGVRFCIVFVSSGPWNRTGHWFWLAVLFYGPGWVWIMQKRIRKSHALTPLKVVSSFCPVQVHLKCRSFRPTRRRRRKSRRNPERRRRCRSTWKTTSPVIATTAPIGAPKNAVYAFYVFKSRPTRFSVLLLHDRRLNLFLTRLRCHLRFDWSVF